MTAGRVRGGQNQYGFTVGILMLDTRFPRIPGDMGNATTLPFPVRNYPVRGAAPDLVVRRGQPAAGARAGGGVPGRGRPLRGLPRRCPHPARHGPQRQGPAALPAGRCRAGHLRSHRRAAPPVPLNGPRPTSPLDPGKPLGVASHAVDRASCPGRRGAGRRLGDERHCGEAAARAQGLLGIRVDPLHERPAHRAGEVPARSYVCASLTDELRGLGHPLFPKLEDGGRRWVNPAEPSPGARAARTL